MTTARAIVLAVERSNKILREEPTVEGIETAAAIACVCSLAAKHIDDAVPPPRNSLLAGLEASRDATLAAMQVPAGHMRDHGARLMTAIEAAMEKPKVGGAGE